MSGGPQFQDDRGFTTTWAIRPDLYLGETPAECVATSVGSAREAIEVIAGGGTAVLPRDRWDLASEVLELAGASQAARVQALALAQFGFVYPVERLSEEQLEAALRGLSTRSGQSGCVCCGCGFFEAASLEEMTTHPERYLPDGCVVCGGAGIPGWPPDEGGA